MSFWLEVEGTIDTVQFAEHGKGFIRFWTPNEPLRGSEGELTTTTIDKFRYDSQEELRIVLYGNMRDIDSIDVFEDWLTKIYKRNKQFIASMDIKATVGCYDYHYTCDTLDEKVFRKETRHDTLIG